MNVLLFTRFSASGKSTLAERINMDLKYQMLREREIIHDLASERGYSRSRYWLQNEGVKCLVDAARSRTLQLVEEARQLRGVIIDGAYDREITQSIKNNFPDANLTIISVIIGRNIREERMRIRLGEKGSLAQYELNGIDYFKREAGVEEVMESADIVIDNSNNIAESEIKLRRELELRRIA